MIKKSEIEPGLVILAAARLKRGISLEQFCAEGHERLAQLTPAELAELEERAKAEVKNPRY